MPVYHSAFNTQSSDVVQFGNIPKLNFTTSSQLKQQQATEEGGDIIDESINLFRINCLFRNFEILGNADRLLIYLILFISECLNKLKVGSTTKDEAFKVLTSHAISQFHIPGDPGFTLNQLYAPPKSKLDADNLRAYLTQVRAEVVVRLLDKLYKDDTSKPSKWWMAFAKRKFMNKTL